MNWDELSAISTFFTMIIIAASAIAAVIQLRHMRAGNAITGFLGFMDRWASPEARAITNYVFSEELQKKIADPAYRQEILSTRMVDRLRNPEFQFLDVWESLGMFVKLGYFAEDAVMESGGGVALRAWEALMPVVALSRQALGPQMFDNFEYVVSRARLWEAKYPDGYWPHRTPHLATQVPGAASDA